MKEMECGQSTKQKRKKKKKTKQINPRYRAKSNVEPWDMNFIANTQSETQKMVKVQQWKKANVMKQQDRGEGRKVKRVSTINCGDHHITVRDFQSNLAEDLFQRLKDAENKAIAAEKRVNQMLLEQKKNDLKFRDFQSMYCPQKKQSKNVMAKDQGEDQEIPKMPECIQKYLRIPTVTNQQDERLQNDQQMISNRNPQHITEVTGMRNVMQKTSFVASPQLLNEGHHVARVAIVDNQSQWMPDVTMRHPVERMMAGEELRMPYNEQWTNWPLRSQNTNLQTNIQSMEKRVENMELMLSDGPKNEEKAPHMVSQQTIQQQPDTADNAKESSLKEVAVTVTPKDTKSSPTKGENNTCCKECIETHPQKMNDNIVNKADIGLYFQPKQDAEINAIVSSSSRSRLAESSIFYSDQSTYFPFYFPFNRQNQIVVPKKNDFKLTHFQSMYYPPNQQSKNVVRKYQADTADNAKEDGVIEAEIGKYLDSVASKEHNPFLPTNLNFEGFVNK